MEPWFSQDAAARFAFLALLSLFALVAIPAERGRHRGLVMAAWNAVLVLSAIMVGVAVLGWAVGQPGYVIRATGFSGLLIGAVFLGLRKVVVSGYREAELRKTVAKDI